MGRLWNGIDSVWLSESKNGINSVRLCSRPEQPGIKLTLIITKHLVGGTIAAGCFQRPGGDILGQRLEIVLNPGQNLLPVRVPDRNAPHAGADNAQRGLVQEHSDNFRRARTARRRQGAEHGSVVPLALGKMVPQLL